MRPAPLGVLVGLVEQPGHDAGAEPPRPVVADGLVAGEQAQEVALADAVAAEHGDALAEPQLEVERIGEPVELELLDDHGPLAGAGAAEAHVDALLAHLRRPLVALVELAQPALGRLQLAARTCRRSSPAGASRRRAPASRLRSSSYHERSRLSFSRRARRASA